MLGASALALTPAAQADDSCPIGEAYLVVHLRGAVNEDKNVCRSTISDWHDLTDPPYRTRSVAGTDPQDEPHPHEALSIRWLTTQLAGEIGGFSADSITYVEVPNPRSTYVARLTAPDLRAAGANGFANNLMPAIFDDPGFGIYFVRPLRPNDQDVNNRDVFPGADSGPLEIYLHTSGQPLYPTIQVDSATSHVTQVSRFAVTFDPPTSEDLTYLWHFGDGATSPQRSPKHTWAEECVCNIYLTVSRPGQPPYQSNVLQVTVGKQIEDDDEEGNGGHGGRHNSHTGQTGGHGGNQDGSHHPTTTPSEQSTEGPNGAPSNGSAPNATDAPPSQQAGSTTTHTDPGGTVVGVVLSGAEVAPAPETDEPEAAARRAGTRQEPLRIPEWVLLALAVLAVLGLGALSETGWVQRRLRGRMRT